ncbi:UvrD-helicase domain-containing protein [Poritiphilus flavus]|uniref:DNA 3'-5' helicase n=1 Tax=Poritiphilus flavus TaxID=2697053 RepID=A0A6L9ECI7_9FLAO|nr:UvrD-helicase domain-containing protein [Poritiphilus flavus]NAS12464.1 UvrD-helicase domain-containing protein [Poritiphilus flavus]
MPETSFKIFNASAGSGKTFTLVKAYLKIILSSDQARSFRQILGVTFTNKAVNEMKQRILGSLFEFSQPKCSPNAEPLFEALEKELDFSSEQLRQRSSHKLKEILHNYAFFDISTIDKFNHRLIRTFAKDLRLPSNFEVVLDTNALLDEAIERLLNKAGEDKKLTALLIAFALDKADEDRHWEITTDLTKVGKLLFEESQTEHLEPLKVKNTEDFLALRKVLLQEIAVAEERMKLKAKQILEIIHENQLQFEDFKSAWFPKFILRIAEGDLFVDFKAGWKQNFGSVPLYNKSTDEGKKSLMDGLMPDFTALFSRIKSDFFRRSMLKNAHGNIVPMTVLNAIQRELSALEKEREQLPISAFNQLISREIKDQPAPYIYERLGEKYRHYFIDEFQDTSQMQWNNLIPLISNALESVDEQGKVGSLTLVGDAKQAIYRWRGGRAEQFLNLINLKTNPFTVAPDVHTLPRNYRSREEIVKFNNSFFSSISSFLSKPEYQSLYAESRQEFNPAKGGYIQLEFLENDPDPDTTYCRKVVQIINEVRERNYLYKDICILTRKRKQGLLVSDVLMQNGIPMVSSETLLLANSTKVRFLINLLLHNLQPEEYEHRFELLRFLAVDVDEKHQFILRNLAKLPSYLREAFGFNADLLSQLSVYDGLEYSIRQFRLAESSDAYLTHLLDEVLLVEQSKGAGIPVFLEHWQKKKDSLSISAPEDLNAVRIMTIHKAKGLEFPIVIYPFANSNIYEEIDPKLWITVEEQNFEGFQELLINKKQELLQYGQEAADRYQDEQQKLELDTFNLLYVALTRAISGLYILTEKKSSKTRRTSPKYFSELFEYFIESNSPGTTNNLIFSFGELPKQKTLEFSAVQETVEHGYTSKDRSDFAIIAKSGMLWDSERAQAIQLGNLVHSIMEDIGSEEDVEQALKAHDLKGQIPPGQEEILRDTVRSIISHRQLRAFYNKNAEGRNEVEIITKNGLILRPDRVVLQGNQASIIDYKTGIPKEAHHHQLKAYAEALEEMGFEIKNNIIVYIAEDITLRFV